MQKNIRAFNGDPAKVTIAGESSGASSVDRLVDTFAPPLIAPFRAAGESSGQATVGGFERKGGQPSWAALVSAVGCNESNDTSPQSELLCMQAADALALRTVATERQLNFSPANDGVTQHELPRTNGRATGDAAHVPLYIGTSAQEGNHLAHSYQLNISTFSEEQVLQFLAATTGGNQTLIGQFYGIIKSIMQTDGLFLFYAAAQFYTELVYQCVSTVLRIGAKRQLIKSTCFVAG